MSITSDDGLGFALVHFTQKRAAAKNMATRQFYDYQIQLCSNHSGIDGVVTFLYDHGLQQGKTNGDDVLVSTVAHLAANSNEFIEDAYRDAQAFLRGLLFPLISANPHIVPTQKTWETIDKDHLYFCVTRFDLEESFLKAPVPAEISHGYQVWKSINTLQIEGENADNGTNFLELKRQHGEALEAATSENIQRLYNLLIKFNDDALNKDGWKYTPEVQRELTEILTIAAHNFADFNDTTTKHVAEFIEFLLLSSEHLEGKMPKDVLATYNQTFMVMVGPINKAILFGAIRNVGLEDRLQKLLGDQTALKPIFRAYDNWKQSPHAKMPAISVAPTEIIEPEPPVVILDQDSQKWTFATYLNLRDSAPNYVLRKFADVMCLGYIDNLRNLGKPVPDFKPATTITDRELRAYRQNKSAFLFKMVSDNIAQYTGDYLRIVREGILATLNPINTDQSSEKNLLKKANFSEICPPHHLFRCVHYFGLQEDFNKSIEEGVVPLKLKAQYKSWLSLTNNQKFIKECEARLNPPPEVDTRLTIIRVDHALVVQGNKTQTMGFRPTDSEAGAAAVKLNKIDQNRTEELYTALFAVIKSYDSQPADTLSKNARMKSIKVFEDVRPVSEGNRINAPYNVVDIEMTDGTHTHVIVCDYLGHMTYVEREAGAYDDTQIKDIEAIRKNDKVWTIPYATKKQWIGGIEELISKPLDELSREVKYRSYWKTLYEPAVDAFVRAVMLTGKPPAKDRETIIHLGEIETTPARLLDAAYRGAMEGVPQKTTPTDLFNMIAYGTNDSYPDIKYPWLLPFKNLPQITAHQVLEAVGEYHRVFGGDEPLTPENYSIVDIDPPSSSKRRTLAHANIAFQFGAVAIPRDLLPAGENPKNLAEFLDCIDRRQGGEAREFKAA